MPHFSQISRELHLNEAYKHNEVRGKQAQGRIPFTLNTLLILSSGDKSRVARMRLQVIDEMRSLMRKRMTELNQSDILFYFHIIARLILL